MADGVTLYEKRGRRYVPVAERETFDELVEALQSYVDALGGVIDGCLVDVEAIREADKNARAVLARLDAIKGAA